MADVTGKVALITGGGTGIGKDIALGFAQAGMKLALAGLEHAPSADNQYGSARIGGYSAAQAVAAELGQGAIAFEADITVVRRPTLTPVNHVKSKSRGADRRPIHAPVNTQKRASWSGLRAGGRKRPVSSAGPRRVRRRRRVAASKRRAIRSA